MNCQYYERYGYPHMPYRAFPSQSNQTTYTQEPYTEGSDPGAVCLPLPTEEFGFTCRICANVERDNGVYANIYFIIDQIIKVTVGTVSYSQSVLDIQFGLVVSVAGLNGSGFGGTFEVKVNTTSGVISSCANLNYGVGTVAPWYGVLSTLGSVIAAPSAG